MSRAIRMLLVEDNPGDADLIKEIFETGPTAFEIATAVDGKQALDYLTRAHPYQNVETPDLILLDLNLPKLDGRQVLTSIKAREELRHIPIVVLTSSDAEQDVVKTYQLGANCYVTKPVGLAEFQTVVRAIEDFWFNVVKLP
jgi:CheY-like chemotaxis protein